MSREESVEAREVVLLAERMSYGPDAVAHDADGKTVFVSGAVAGDRVRAVVDRDEGRFSHARAVEVLEASADRVAPACPYAGVCGGCPWASLSYEAQAAAKRSGVVDALARIGHMGAERAEGLVAPIVSPGEPWGYRNKVELAVATEAGALRSGCTRPPARAWWAHSPIWAAPPWRNA